MFSSIERIQLLNLSNFCVTTSRLHGETQSLRDVPFLVRRECIREQVGVLHANDNNRGVLIIIIES